MDDVKQRRSECMRLQSALAELIKGEEFGNQVLSLTRVLRMVITDNSDDDDGAYLQALAEVHQPFSECVEFLERYANDEVEIDDFPF